MLHPNVDSLRSKSARDVRHRLPPSKNGSDVTTAAVSHLAASTRPDALLMASFMNDWTLDHVAGYAPRSLRGRGAAPTTPGLGLEVDTERLGAPIWVSSKDGRCA